MLDEDVDTDTEGSDVELDPGPTSAAGFVAFVVFDDKAHEIPPITCERNTLSWTIMRCAMSKTLHKTLKRYDADMSLKLTIQVSLVCPRLVYQLRPATPLPPTPAPRSWYHAVGCGDP